MKNIYFKLQLTEDFHWYRLIKNFGIYKIQEYDQCYDCWQPYNMHLKLKNALYNFGCKVDSFEDVENT